VITAHFTAKREIPEPRPVPARCPTYQVLDVPIFASTIVQAVELVSDVISSGGSIQIGVVNAAKIVNMRRNPELRKAVLDSDVIFADGMSVVWASRILGCRLPERVAGIDLMYKILERGSKVGWRFYCLGATSEVLMKTCDVFKSKFPGIRLVGSHHGYFSSSDSKDVAENIRRARPDVVFVAISSPKKEKFMSQWGGFIDAHVVHGVGGSFDVVSGKVARAPVAWQRIGLEWLYRLLREPKRLWRRYLVTNTMFIALVIREKLRRLLK